MQFTTVDALPIGGAFAFENTEHTFCGMLSKCPSPWDKISLNLLFANFSRHPHFRCYLLQLPAVLPVLLPFFLRRQRQQQRRKPWTRRGSIMQFQS